MLDTQPAILSVAAFSVRLAVSILVLTSVIKYSGPAAEITMTDWSLLWVFFILRTRPSATKISSPVASSITNRCTNVLCCIPCMFTS